MATPVLNSAIMRFRRYVGDMHDNTTGQLITLPTQNGNEFSADEAKDLVVDACCELVKMVAGSVPTGPATYDEAYKASVAATALPEYRMRAPNLPVSASGKVATCDLPDDFLLFVSAVYVPSSGRSMRIRLRPDVDLDMAEIEQNAAASSTPRASVVGKQLRIVLVSPVPTSSDKVHLTYLSSQPDVQINGTTDIRMRVDRILQIVALMKRIADSHAE